MPVVTTLHTVLKSPSSGQMAVLGRVAQASERMVVMSHRAIDILKAVYGVPEQKIVKIHHGIPDMPFVDPNLSLRVIKYEFYNSLFYMTY
jgi:hypothetical protein